MRKIGEIIHERIQKAYPSAGFRSLSAVARYVGIPITTLSGWKDIKTPPAADALRKVALALRVTEEYLLGEQTLDDARLRFDKIAAVQITSTSRRLPLVSCAEDVVKLRWSRKTNEQWRGDTIEVPDALFGDAAVRIEDESMCPPVVPGTYVAFRQQTEVPINSIVVLEKQDGTLCVRLSTLRNGKLLFVPTNPEYMTYTQNDVKVVGVCTGIVHTDASVLARYAKPPK